MRHRGPWPASIILIGLDWIECTGDMLSVMDATVWSGAVSLSHAAMVWSVTCLLYDCVRLCMTSSSI